MLMHILSVKNKHQFVKIKLSRAKKLLHFLQLHVYNTITGWYRMTVSFINTTFKTQLILCLIILMRQNKLTL